MNENKNLINDLSLFIEKNIVIIESRPLMARSASFSLDSDNDLNEFLNKSTDETFTESILKLIDEKGEKDSDVYKRAGMDRKHFSKIRSDKYYRPKRDTVMKLALSLKLDENETICLLSKCGYAFNYSDKTDLAVIYFIRNGVYDLSYVNETLSALSLRTLNSY